jgi:hypothetical protein
VLIVTFASMGTLVMTLENNIATTQRTLWNSKAMTYFRETSISFFWVGGYNKLNQFNEGDLVFADGLGDSKVFGTSYNCSNEFLRQLGGWQFPPHRIWSWYIP